MLDDPLSDSDTSHWIERSGSTASAIADASVVIERGTETGITIAHIFLNGKTIDLYPDYSRIFIKSNAFELFVSTPQTHALRFCSRYPHP